MKKKNLQTTRQEYATHNILRLSGILQKLTFTTSETMLDYYL